MTDEQAKVLIELLWNYMRKDREHKDRVHTGWGTKTKTGLVACIARIVEDNELPQTEGQSLDGRWY